MAWACTPKLFTIPLRDKRAVWQSLTKERACKTKEGMPLSKKEKDSADK